MRALLLITLLAGCFGGSFGDMGFDIGVDSGDPGGANCTVLEPSSVSFQDDLREIRTVNLFLQAGCEDQHIMDVADPTLDDPHEAFELISVVRNDASVLISLRFIATEPGAYEAQLIMNTGFDGLVRHTTQLFAELPAQ
ncbi:MAG: hypothetical protein ACI9MC_003286 [Kiritimatiellia bacterium]|jgi:hypothetical protein